MKKLGSIYDNMFQYNPEEDDDLETEYDSEEDDDLETEYDSEEIYRNLLTGNQNPLANDAAKEYRGRQYKEFEKKRFYFWKKKLCEQTKKIEDIILGKENSILPYIQTKQGVYSETKTWNLIGELIYALEEYGKRESLWINQETKEVIDEMPKDIKEYVMCYLYCMIRVMSGEQELFDVIYECQTYPKTCFGQFLDSALEIHTEEEKYEEIFEEFNGCILGSKGIFYYCNYLYEILTGEKIEDTIAEDVKSKMEELYQKELEEFDAYLEELAAYDFEQNQLPEEEQLSEEELDMLVALHREDILSQEEEFSEEEYSYEDEEKRMMEECWNNLSEEQKAYMEWHDKAYDRFHQTFTNADVFCKCFLRFRELHFSDLMYYQKRFPQMIEGMLDLFFWKNGLSYLEDEDAFMKAMTYLRRATREIEKLK